MRMYIPLRVIYVKVYMFLKYEGVRSNATNDTKCGIVFFFI